jgi:hypothetical protein
MGWGEVREAVRLAIAKAMRLDDETDQLGNEYRHVEWENRASAQRMVESTFVDLRFSGPTAIGTDEIRYDYDSENDINVAEYGGFRIFGVQVLAQSDSQEPDADAVGVMAGRLRTRIRRPDVLEILQAAGVAFVRADPSFDVSYENAEGRAMSASSTDLTFSTVEYDRDEEEDSGYVSNAELDGTISNGDTDIEIPVIVGEITPEPEP